MSFPLIILAVLMVNSIAIIAILRYVSRHPSNSLTIGMRLRLAFSGVVAFFADTIGIGSFAVNILFAKIFGSFEDAEFPAMTNIAQVIPGILEAMFFMSYFHVDFTTLVTLVVATSVGGVIGGFTMTRLDQRLLKVAMIVAFSVIILLLTAVQCHWLPMDGALTSLRGGQLFLAAMGLVFAGMLTAAGVGLYVMVQSVLFMLNMSPLVAFPIMTLAGAMQQPLTAMIFLKTPNLPVRKILHVSLWGCLGVFIGLTVVSQLSPVWLRWLLLAIVGYNLVSVAQSLIRTRRITASQTA